MAEFIFKKIISDRHMSDAFEISSAATSDEEIWNGTGNPIYTPALEQLRRHNIPCDGHRAIQITERDYDYLVYMDKMNYKNMMRIIQADPLNKCIRLMDLTERPRDVSDPWYTGNFEKTFTDLNSGCSALADFIIQKIKP
ncbi:MAG: low molecular weight phosphotyrosine protein phosphatase [Ruminobacter sp.]|nr:low molecular weight phosphotyrosine protein phosphatase [Ruminobacter sp.]